MAPSLADAFDRQLLAGSDLPRKAAMGRLTPFESDDDRLLTLANLDITSASWLHCSASAWAAELQGCRSNLN